MPERVFPGGVNSRVSYFSEQHLLVVAQIKVSERKAGILLPARLCSLLACASITWLLLLPFLADTRVQLLWVSNGARKLANLQESPRPAVLGFKAPVPVG